MTAFAAFRDGIRRVNGAPMLVAGLCAVTLFIALPLSFAIRESIEAQLGRSLMADVLAGGADYGWWQEFSSQASGLAATFVPSILGFGAVLQNLGGVLDNTELAVTIAGITLVWLAIWSFLSGGAMDRLARDRRTRSQAFFAASGVHFWRFLRLGVLAWVVYGLLFGYVHGFIFTSAYDSLTRDLTVERTGFLIRAACYLLFGLLLVICNIAFDYARVRIVVEDRRSAIGALAAGVRFAWRLRGRTVWLYVLNGAAFLVLVLAYALLSPGAPGAGLSGWVVLLVGQTYIVGRHYLKLVFYASEIALFQRALAHASYTAAPPVVWPDSPAAESIVNAEPPPATGTA
jgi:hypothetical protein